MYEDLTYEVILENMLARIDTDVDKTEGSLIYNALAPAAWELAEAYIAIDHIYDSTFADTAPREELIRRAKERGIAPREATNAILKGEFDVDVPIGSRFSWNDLNYIVTEKIEPKVYKLQCETAGTIGNKKYIPLTAIEFVEGLNEANITEVLIPAVDEEETEHFRERYFASFDSQAFGGNIADYIRNTEAMEGVGGAKYYRVSEESSHIKIQIISSDYGVPSNTLIDRVQKTLDPKANEQGVLAQGQGYGIAPIGHVVDVEGCSSIVVDVSAKFTYDTGYNWDSVKNKVGSVIENYFLELSKTWSDNQNLIVRIAQLEARLLGVVGITDISETTLNSKAENLILEANIIPVRGNVNAN
ncbi:baseplate J/gp47 family protein [Anaeromicropila herbilytica]|uniref:Baseplate assembly protein n=1 Tax=Anaeromicropila herbilytica TaxID=2785025 RepID=A0A7R7IDZ0_9FIRM|nr:baseplate J/gp47 family protein [Anaeromicropila herbilytica]BCN32062.1 baseplate assembly protein [Anaeromicropila herbilytica]